MAVNNNTIILFILFEKHPSRGKLSMEYSHQMGHYELVFSRVDETQRMIAYGEGEDVYNRMMGTYFKNEYPDLRFRNRTFL
jgi:hypothetical protein